MATSLTELDILTSSGKFPGRKDQATALIRMEARITAAKLNLLLEELGYVHELKISSGFRPPAANAAAGGAKRSLHMEGKAVDFLGQELGHYIRAHPQGAELLRKYGLFMEALEYSASWTHIDRGTRADRPSREFRP
jgi:hypothetical protein